MPGPRVPPTLLLALDKLDKADGKALLKSAVKELISRRVLGVEELDEPRRLRRARRRLVLVDGPAPVPAERPLTWVAGMIEKAPAEVVDGRVVRDLAKVAKHLAGQPQVRKVVVGVALTQLADTGLVVMTERKALGMFKRTVHARTPAGDAALAAGAEPRERRRSRDGTDAGGGYYAAGAGGDEHDLGEAFDSNFDSSFDSSFDSAFDSSFDSGFSSGDSGGGGGDGGGGGGDGGGS